MRVASPDRSVRPAVPGDAAAIAHIQATGMETVLARLSVGPDGVTPLAVDKSVPQVPERTVREQWVETLSAPRPEGCHTLVALHGAGVAGFASCAPGGEVEPVPGREAPIVAGTDILALEVAPDFARSGHGSRLLAALADLTGAPNLRVWITAGDDPRVRFFQSAGFAPAGVGRRLAAGSGVLVEHLWTADIER